MRSPNTISVSNGSVSPSSSSRSHSTTDVPVRVPSSFIVTSSSRTRSVGAVLSNRSIFDFVERTRDANMSLPIDARLRYSCSDRSRRLRSSPQRRWASSMRAMRSSRASCQVANEAPCVHAVLPSSVTTLSAAAASSARSWLISRIVFALACSASSSHSLPATSR